MMNEESKNNDFEVLKRLTVYGQAGLLGNIEVLRVDNDASRPEVFLFEDTRFPDCGNAPEWRAAFVNELHSCFGAGVETVWMCALGDAAVCRLAGWRKGPRILGDGGEFKQAWGLPREIWLRANNALLN